MELGNINFSIFRPKQKIIENIICIPHFEGISFLIFKKNRIFFAKIAFQKFIFIGLFICMIVLL